MLFFFWRVGHFSSYSESEGYLLFKLKLFSEGVSVPLNWSFKYIMLALSSEVDKVACLESHTKHRGYVCVCAFSLVTGVGVGGPMAGKISYS